MGVPRAANRSLQDQSTLAAEDGALTRAVVWGLRELQAPLVTIAPANTQVHLGGVLCKGCAVLLLLLLKINCNCIQQESQRQQVALMKLKRRRGLGTQCPGFIKS